MQRARRIGMPPTDRAHPGYQSKPVREQNEDENGGEEPKRLPNQVMPNNALEEFVKGLDQPFREILRAFGHLANRARRPPRKQDQGRGDNPR